MRRNRRIEPVLDPRNVAQQQEQASGDILILQFNKMAALHKWLWTGSGAAPFLVGPVVIAELRVKLPARTAALLEEDQ